MSKWSQIHGGGSAPAWTAIVPVKSYLQGIAAGIKPCKTHQLAYTMNLGQSVARDVQMSQRGGQHLWQQGQ